MNYLQPNLGIKRRKISSKTLAPSTQPHQRSDEHSRKHLKAPTALGKVDCLIGIKLTSAATFNANENKKNSDILFSFVFIESLIENALHVCFAINLLQ